jgi:threonine dehydratase
MKFTGSHIDEAYENIKDIVKKTPLEFSQYLSEKYDAKIYLKREDLHNVKSYKIRGAYNLISSLNNPEGIVSASTGNHAQGVAYSCNKLKIPGKIFMPRITPNIKIEKVKHFGGDWITITLVGEMFDDAYKIAKEYSRLQQMEFIHPFDDYKVIAGGGTIAVEILQDLHDIDYIIVPIGGGGLISGIGTYIKNKLSNSYIIGAIPAGCTSMYKSVLQQKLMEVKEIDTFVDGAAVKKPGDITFKITSKVVDKLCLIPNKHLVSTMEELYRHENIIAEPAGALSVATLDYFKKKIKGKIVICIVSGGNCDETKLPRELRKTSQRKN